MSMHAIEDLIEETVCPEWALFGSRYDVLLVFAFN